MFATIKKIVFSVIKFIFKEICSFFLKLFLLFIILGIIFVGVITLVEEKFNPTNSITGKNLCLSIDLSTEYPERSSEIDKLLGEKNNFYSLLEKLESVKTDEKISQLYVKLDNLSLDKAQIEELSKKLNEIKKNEKKVIGYATRVNNNNYSLALDCSEFYMPPTMAGGVEIGGYYTTFNYYKKLFDFVGVKFTAIHVGDYKSYGENYTKENMSEEFKENITHLKDKVFNNFIEKFKNRNINSELIKEKVLNGDFIASEPYNMEKFNLVDGLKYENDIISEIGADKIIEIEKYTPENRKDTENKIAIIYIDGEIVDGNSEQIGTVSYGLISSEIETLKKMKNIKGVVVRVNSPGGSALASNLIYNKLSNLKKDIPIYVSIGGVGASGGYYISSVGDKIFADKESITGSIGVVSLIPNGEELVKKLNINVENIKKGRYSDLYSITKNLSKDEIDKIYAGSEKVYQEFLDIVAQSRGMNREEVHKIAQGKVWLGEEAVGIGIVDKNGGLEETISALANDLNLPDYTVLEVTKDKNIKSILKNYLNFKKVIQENIEKDNWQITPLYLFPYNI